MSLIYLSDIVVNDSYNTSSSNNNNNNQQQQRRQSGLYIGSKVEAKNYNLLTKQWNVTHIINVTPCKRLGIIAGVQNYFENSSTNLKYLRIPILDIPNDATELLYNYSNKIISFISIGLHHGSVFVHCQRGISRSTTAIMFYLMRRVGMTFTNALELIKSRRPQAEPIPAFITILKQYEQQCIIDGAIIVSSSSRPYDMTTGISAADDDNVDQKESTNKKMSFSNDDRSTGNSQILSTDIATTGSATTTTSSASTARTRKRGRLIDEMNMTSDVNVRQVIIGPSVPNVSLTATTSTSSIETSANPTKPPKTIQGATKAMIGPTRPPASNDNDLTYPSPIKRAMIGPARPLASNIDDSTYPSPIKKAMIGPTRPPASNIDDSTNPAPIKKAMMIGPTRPPVSNIDDSTYPLPIKKAMIGPTRPPTLNAYDSTNPSPIKKAMIGPSLPPNM